MTEEKSPNKGEPIGLTQSEVEALLEKYDKNKNGSLSDEELQQIAKDFANNAIKDEILQKILSKFDSNNDKALDHHEIKQLKKSVEFHDTALRYAGYSAVGARAFRYLAFTSDFGEGTPVLMFRRHSSCSI